MMKRGSASFGKSPVCDDELKAKLKYQTLLDEYLALQKDNVAKKKKLQAAKQRRETLQDEVRFLRHRHKHLVGVSDCNSEDILRVPSPDVQINALEAEGNQGFSEAVTESLDQVLVKQSSARNEDEEGQWQNPDKNIRLVKEPVNLFVHDKKLGKRKISWSNLNTMEL